MQDFVVIYRILTHYPAPVRLSNLEDFFEKRARTRAKTRTRGDNDRDEKGIALIVINECRSSSFIASRILLSSQKIQNCAGASQSARASKRALCNGKTAALEHNFPPIWFEIHDVGIVRYSSSIHSPGT